MQTLTDAAFTTAAAATEWLAIDFGAPSCAPCVPFAKTVGALAADYAGRVAFAAMDADAEPETAARFGIRGLPTLLLLHRGAEVGRLVGNHSREKVQKFLDKIVAATDPRA